MSDDARVPPKAANSKPAKSTTSVKPRVVKPRVARARAAKARVAKPASRAARGLPSPAATATILTRLRALCLALPHATERISHGGPTWFVDDKRAFAQLSDDHHGDGRLALVCAAPDGMQAMLVESDPERYYLPPYVAHLGWVGIRLDRDTPWTAIASAIEHAFVHRAPKTLLARWTAGAAKKPS